MVIPPPALHALHPGDVLAGKYRIEAVLGSGGMGVVVVARHARLRERVALKLMLPGRASDATAVVRFLREARAAARIKSEHVVRVFDADTLEDGTPYLAMEYLEGRDLQAVLHSRGRIPVPEAIDLILQACEALAEAHSLGVVHRDIKPANLFLSQRGRLEPTLKVLDFGISKLVDAVDEPSVTRTESFLGSPRYMSPEQLRRPRDVDARTDIWSLGAVLYELVTGEPPFRGETLSDLCVNIVTETPRSIADLVREAPAALEAVVRRCLAKDPSARYPNVAALATGLVGLVASSPRAQAALERVRSWDRPLLPSNLDASDSNTSGLLEKSRSAPSSGTLTVSATKLIAESPRSRRSLVLPLALVAAVLAGGLGFWMQRDRAGDRPPPTASVATFQPPSIPNIATANAPAIPNAAVASATPLDPAPQATTASSHASKPRSANGQTPVGPRSPHAAPSSAPTSNASPSTRGSSEHVRTDSVFDNRKL